MAVNDSVSNSIVDVACEVVRVVKDVALPTSGTAHLSAAEDQRARTVAVALALATLVTEYGFNVRDVIDVVRSLAMIQRLARENKASPNHVGSVLRGAKLSLVRNG